MRIFMTALLIGSPLWAQEGFAFKDGDMPLSAAAMQTRLEGQSLTFFDDGVSRYFDDGRYTYTYAQDGGTAHGYWTITEEGAVCVEFVHGVARCDRIVENKGRLILLDERGDRYPIRP